MSYQRCQTASYLTTAPIPRDEVLADIERLPTLPSAVGEVLRLTADPGTSFAQVAAAIATDPVLTARLLRVVNSAYFGFSSQIATIHQAVVILGLQAVRLLTISAAAAEFSKALSLPAGVNLEAFWRHSTAVASSTVDVARNVPNCRWDQALVAGLLHDIGILVLACAAPDRYADALQYALETRSRLSVAEECILGTDHTKVGALVAQRWGLPPSLVRTIRFHHEPEKAEGDAPLAAAVHIANAISVAAGIRVCRLNSSSYVSPEVWDLLGGVVSGMGPEELQRYAFYLKNNQERIGDLACRIIAA